jgi:hypothetical protein
MATKAQSKAGSQIAVKNTEANLVAIREQMARDVAALEGKTAPPSGIAIRITQDKQFILPNGVKTPGPLSLVIVDFNSQNKYYTDAYDPKNILPPVCFAIGDSPTTLVPSVNSPERQADACATCPMNQFGSAPKGEGKACKNTRVLAVLPGDADADTPLWTLSVSPTSNKVFDGYVKDIARQFQVAPYGVITTVSFDPNVTYASLVFGDPHPNTNLEVAFSRRAEAAKLLQTEPDVSSYEAPKKGAIKPMTRRK